MSSPASPGSTDSGFCDSEVKENDMFKIVHSLPLQQLQAQFRKRNNLYAACSDPMEYDTPMPSMQETTGYDKNDIPDLIKRPAFGTEYEKHSDKSRLYYDYNSSSFRRHAEIFSQSNDPWFEIQMQCHQIEPFMQFGSLGFKFGLPNIEHVMRKILSRCDSLEQNYKDFVFVKVKSIQAIYLLTTCHHLEANKLLHVIENEVERMQDCDLTAWFYIASFWSLIKDMLGLKYTGKIQKYYKTRCLNHLQKAKAGFIASGYGFDVETVLTMWWMFLAQADLVKCAVNLDAGPVLKIQADVAVSEEYLFNFLNASVKVEGFPWIERKHEFLIKCFETFIQTQKSNPSSLTCEVGDDEEDEELLKRIYYDFLSRIDGREPECIQQITRNEEDGKIYIYTTEDSEELLQFLKEYNADSPYFALRIGGGVTLFHPDSEGICNALIPVIVRKTICPGSVLFKVPYDHWVQNKIPRKMEDLLKQESLEMLGMCTLGGFITNVRDSNPENMQILTSGHSFNDDLELKTRLSFLSAHTAEPSNAANEAERVLYEVSNLDYTGRYGGEFVSNQQGCRVLVDAIVIDLPDEICKEPHIDLEFKQMGLPMEMKIYDGNFEDLLGIKVSIYGCISGICLSQGTIVHTNVEGIRIPKKGLCSGLMAINLDQEYRSDGRVRLASEGDSGAIVFAENERASALDGKRGYIAIGLVLGKNNSPCQNNKLPEKHFAQVTYCTALKYAKEYFKTKGKEIQINTPPKPQAHTDSGYSSGHRNPFHEKDDESEEDAIKKRAHKKQCMAMKSTWSMLSNSSTDSYVSMDSLVEHFESLPFIANADSKSDNTEQFLSACDSPAYEASWEDFSAEEDTPVLVSSTDGCKGESSTVRGLEEMRHSDQSIAGESLMDDLVKDTERTKLDVKSRTDRPNLMTGARLNVRTIKKVDSLQDCNKGSALLSQSMGENTTPSSPSDDDISLSDVSFLLFDVLPQDHLVCKTSTPQSDVSTHSPIISDVDSTLESDIEGFNL